MPASILCKRIGRSREVHENARNMYRAEILGKNIGKLGESVIWEATIW